MSLEIKTGPVKTGPCATGKEGELVAMKLGIQGATGIIITEARIALQVMDVPVGRLETAEAHEGEEGDPECNHQAFHRYHSFGLNEFTRVIAGSGPVPGRSGAGRGEQAA